ncbi:MAG: heparinase II/III family protein [Pseudorhodoplanes sp.]
MPGVSIAVRTKLSWLLVRRGMRSGMGRLNSHPLIRWRFFRPKADRLVIAPQDLRTADPTRASEIYAGRFALAGKIVICDGRSPFEMTPPSDEWAMQLLGFGWLRHLRAAESGITRANARALVDEWIMLQGSWHPIGWRPEVLARRIMSWLSQAPLIVHDTDVQFYRRFMRSLARQVRYLRQVAKEAPDGVPRLQTIIALTYAALCMQGQIRHLKVAVKALVEELERQILPDGGHLSRNPEALIDLIADLLPLRQAFASRNVPPPQTLLTAIDRMMPMLRFFRHGDGNFGLFNGMGPTPPDLLATLLAYDDTRGQPVANAPHSGYQRLDSKELTVLMDTGRPPPMAVSQEAHAGCLSFEMSTRQHRIVVNCGLPAIARDSWRDVARATAAHSTAVLNDASSCRFLNAGSFRKLIGMPVVAGPQHVVVEREDHENAILLRASHDGYAARFGVIHQRSLALSADGSRLNGEDVFLPAAGDAMPASGRDEFAVRFHLHPSIKASRLTDTRGVMLMLPNRDVWTFNTPDNEVELEESVYLAGNDGPRRTIQIVIYGSIRQSPRVPWSFSHVPAPGAAAAPRRGRGGEPQLPL